MAAKLLHTLADDNSDLQKKIGCMNGIFQVFDRNHVVTNRRKSLTFGNAHVNSINCDRNSVDSIYQERSKDRNLISRSPKNEKLVKVSPESSRLSFSSSCASSPSSPELNKEAEPETSAYDWVTFSESLASDPVMSQGNGSAHLGLDLRDVVRDSMYREARGLSVKTPKVRERREDSPRPYGLKQSTPVDFDESCRALAKLKKKPQLYNDVDMKDASRNSVDSDNKVKSRQKLKELPRLSLDSRERVDLKSGKLYERFSESSSMQRVSEHEELSKGSLKRPPSVVAKLMGLEALPDSPLRRDTHQLNLFGDNNTDPFSRSLRENSLNQAIRFAPSSPRSLGKDASSSSRWRNSEFVMKPLSSLRYPIEPAPWKQTDRNRFSQNQSCRSVKSLSQSSPTLCREMQGRLKDLNFKHSGNDLRALQEILETVQSKGFFDTQEQLQSSNFEVQRDSRSLHNRVVPSDIRGMSCSSSSSSIELFETPIVIMKPAKLVEKSGIPSSSLIPIHSLSDLNKKRREEPVNGRRRSASRKAVEDLCPGNQRAESCISSVDKKSSRKTKLSSSSKPHQVTKESTSKNSGSTNPRLQQMMLEYDKRSRPPTPPSDSSKSRSQVSQQPSESTSPGGRRKLRVQKSLQQNDDQLSQVSNESKTSSHPVVNLCPQSETEATEFDGGKSQSVIEAAKAILSNLMVNKSSSRFNEDRSLANHSEVAPDHPSPVSVLNTSIYKEIGQSHVKIQTSECSDEQCEDQWNPAYSFSETASSFSPEINRKKLQNVEHLVQKLRRLNSSHDEASQDYIASLCENTDPNTDHRYISEILLASGLLLRDLGSGLTTFQLHPSGHPINPELFLVLEQTKGSSIITTSKVLNNEKLNRKLVFDTVNEMLVKKLAFMEGTPYPWMKPAIITKKVLSAQQLLKELCFEIETLQKQTKKRSENLLVLEEEEEDFLKCVLAEDVTIRSGNWTDFDDEMPGIVLDLERLLFKDLVSEIVHGETGRLQAKLGRRRTLSSEHIHK